MGGGQIRVLASTGQGTAKNTRTASSWGGAWQVLPPFPKEPTGHTLVRDSAWSWRQGALIGGLLLPPQSYYYQEGSY